ncbi:MAG: dihydrofolate reductase [Bacteroidaceae bacterium]|nr:dihydrofolate reductase [Bacteroidaceae bacterium]
MISLIAAVAENGAIGFENKLLYWLPNDLKRFKALTTGHTIVMGRRTFESLPKGALPNRRNIVLSRNPDFQAPAVEVFASLEEVLRVVEQTVANETEEGVRPDNEVFVIGGASVYMAALPLADRLCLTLVHDSPKAADAFFPVFDPQEWRVEHEERHDADERHAFPYTFIDYVRA